MTPMGSTEPSALVSHPPASHQQRQRERQAPPDRQRNVHGYAQDDEQHPEDFAFHQDNLTTDEQQGIAVIATESRVIAEIENTFIGECKSVLSMNSVEIFFRSRAMTAIP